MGTDTLTDTIISHAQFLNLTNPDIDKTSLIIRIYNMKSLRLTPQVTLYQNKTNT